MIKKLLQPGTLYKLVLLFLLAGMAALGRQFAYLGLSERLGLPLYITEIVLIPSLYLGFLGYCLSPGLQKRLKTPINGALAVYWLWGLVLLVVALPMYGFDAIRDFVVVYYSLFIFVTIATLRTVEDVKQLFYVIIAANLVYTLTVVLRVIRGDFQIFGGIYLRMGGGTQGLYSIIGFVFALVLYLIRFKTARHSRWLLALLPLFLAGILGSQARSLILAIIGALVVLLLFLPQWGRPRLIRILTLTFLGTSALIAIIPNGIAVISGQLPKYLHFFDPQEGSNAARLMNYQLALNDIAANPIAGVGFGTPRFFVYSSVNQLVRAPHNSYLDIAFRSGIVGLALFLLFLTRFYYYTVRNILQVSDPQLRGYAVAVLAAQVAVAIQAIFNVTLEGPHEGIMFWILIGAELRVLQLAESRMVDQVPVPAPASNFP